MLRKNTNQIIDACLNATKEYDDLCKGFLGSPGKEGIDRKIEFLKIIKGLQKNTPEEAFIKIYDFYWSQKGTSRLNKLIENELMQILDMPEPKLTGSISNSRYASEIQNRNKTFYEAASSIRSELGITEDKNEVLLRAI